VIGFAASIVQTSQQIRNRARRIWLPIFSMWLSHQRFYTGNKCPCVNA